MFKHQKRGAEALRARAEAYGGRLDRTTVLKIVLPVVLLYFFGAYCLYWQLLLACGYALIAFVLAFMLLVPAQISINYYRQGLIERHLFITSMSEALSNKSQTFITSLHMAQFGLHGEFRQDLSRLENTLHNTSRNSMQRHISFEYFHKKYHEDTFFCQFLDQLEDAAQTGRSDQRTCDTISKFHNALYTEQQRYIQKRAFLMKCMFGFAYFMFATFMFSVLLFGFHKNYMHLWAHFWLANWVFSPIFLAWLSLGIAMSYKLDHDESLMTL